MVHILLSWLVLSAAFWLTAEILPGFRVTSFQGALRVAAIFGVINWLIGWLLFFMIGVATLFIGFLLAFLTRWVVNVILLKITDALTDNLTIDTTGTAVIGALSISFFGTLGEWLIHRV
jgi:putative membrane protein